MKEIKVTIEGKEFTIDIEQAQKLGLLKEDTTIKDFHHGDMYSVSDGYEAIILVENGYKSRKYNIIGLCNSLEYYSDFSGNGISKEKMLEYLNDDFTTKNFIKNINDDFEKLVKDALTDFNK
jgi:hypothetical protein